MCTPSDNPYAPPQPADAPENDPALRWANFTFDASRAVRMDATIGWDDYWQAQRLYAGRKRGVGMRAALTLVLGGLGVYVVLVGDLAAVPTFVCLLVLMLAVLAVPYFQRRTLRRVWLRSNLVDLRVTRLITEQEIQ